MLPDARKQSRFHPALRWVVGKLLAAGVATVTVTFYTAPIIAYHFNYISLVSLPANIALALGVYVVTAVGLASLALAYVPYVGICLGWFGTKVTDAMLGVVNYLGSGSYSAVYVASPSLVVIIGYYALLYVALDWLRSLTDRDRRSAYITALAVLTAILCVYALLPVRGQLNVTVMDVGEGLCIVMRTPSGKTAVMDCGSCSRRDNEAVGESVVVPYLTKAGVRDIDVAIASHPHEDNISGFPGCLRSFDRT